MNVKTQRELFVNYAVTQTAGIYMSVPGNDEPIFAAYGQDNCVYTKDGTAASPHLKSVYDPISEAENQAIRPNPTCRNDDPGRRTLDGGMGSNFVSLLAFLSGGNIIDGKMSGIPVVEKK